MKLYYTHPSWDELIFVKKKFTNKSISFSAVKNCVICLRIYQESFKWCLSARSVDL